MSLRAPASQARSASMPYIYAAAQRCQHTLCALQLGRRSVSHIDCNLIRGHRHNHSRHLRPRCAVLGTVCPDCAAPQHRSQPSADRWQIQMHINHRGSKHKITTFVPGTRFLDHSNRTCESFPTMYRSGGVPASDSATSTRWKTGSSGRAMAAATNPGGSAPQRGPKVAPGLPTLFTPDF